MKHFYIKTDRTFTLIRKNGWILTFLIAIGGLWEHKLGLLALPLMAMFVGIAFFRGRYWCGNFCPHGSYFDSFVYTFARNHKIPKFFQSKIWIGLFFVWFLSKLTFKFVKVAALWGGMTFWDKLGFIFVAAYLMVIVVGGILAIFFNARTWCQFCPMGTMQKMVYRLGKFLKVAKYTDVKISVEHTDKCHVCGKCSRVCPMQLSPYLDFSEKNQFDHEDCIRCNTCANNCPAGILDLSKEKEAVQMSDESNLYGYEKRQVIESEIVAVREMGSDVKEFTFRFITPETVEYEAGQFILVRILEEPVMYRAYSISSYNKDGNSLSITVKQAPNGFGTTKILNDFAVGDKVTLEGPMGHELIVQDDVEHILLVAGGIGITPFVPIVQNLIEKNHAAKSITLVYGANKEQEFLYREHFSTLEQKAENFSFVPVAAFDDSWSGAKGFVTDVIDTMDLDGHNVYMCGPKPMVDATVGKLTDKGVDLNRVFAESA